MTAFSVMSPAQHASSRPQARATDPVLDTLKSRKRDPGEASFFYFDHKFQSAAVKVLPGEYFVNDEDVPILTVLGSCIAACLWDRRARVGGMNHFMLPEGTDEHGRYGSFAMELLINSLLKRGASRSSLEAKVFGGGQVMSNFTTLNVGVRNTQFVTDYLQTERIPIVSKDVLDVHPRKVCFFPASGKALVKRLANTQVDALVAQEQAASRTPLPAASKAGSVDLF